MDANDLPVLEQLVHIERLIDAIDLPIGRWDLEHRLVFCNNPYLQWAQRSREDLLGHTLQELFGDEAWARAQCAFAQAAEGRTVNYERRLNHGCHAGRWARIQVLPHLDPAGRVDGIFTIAIDIHQDVLEREALVAARQRLDRFTENIPFPLTYVDRDFVLRFVNKAYVEATGQQPKQLLGRPIGDVRGAKRWAEHEPYFDRALAGHTVQYTRMVDLVTLGRRWMRTSYVPDFGPDGDVIGVYTVTVDVHELTITQEQLKRSVERDALTDVLSRRTMMDRIEAALVDPAQMPVALFFVDLDGFKEVNDRRGHRVGDELLVAVASALQASVRAEDAVGRFGGDEFLVLAPVRDTAGAHALALHMLSAVAAVDRHGISASIGYALAPADAQNAPRLLQLADDAMYAAKRQGKNCVIHACAESGASR